MFTLTLIEIDAHNKMKIELSDCIDGSYDDGYCILIQRRCVVFGALYSY